MQIPSLEDLTTAKSKIDSLEPIQLKTLLGRDSIKIDLNLIKPVINNKSVCVTGDVGP